MFFTVPADFATPTLESYGTRELSCSRYPIREVYGSLPSKVLPSGRHSDVLPEKKEELAGYVGKARSLGIDFNYTINASCLGNRDLTTGGLSCLHSAIQELYDCGIRRFTVTLAPLVDYFNRNFPDTAIYLSVVYGMDSPQKMQRFLERRNVHGIYVHENLHRDLRRLENLVGFCQERGIETGMLVNSLCDIHCPFRPYHYNLVSHSGDTEELPYLWYYGIECNLRRLNDPREVLRLPIVRPEDLSLYADMGIVRYKVAGRDLIRFGADFKRVVGVYNSGCYAGNLIELMFAFADCERADLYKLENSETFGNYVRDVLAGKLHCQECDNCGKCSELCQQVYQSDAVRREYTRMYEERRRRYMNMCTLNITRN